MKNNPFDNARIILVGTTHPGNIGAAARAMKTMGLTKLSLVSPKLFPSADATARAAGADDVLATTRVYASLQEAVADCVLVYGTSARSRSLPCPVISPEQAAVELLDCAKKPSEVAIVFGRERTGLTNEELDVCHKMIVIPANPGFSSLNLASAVQLVSYELCKLVSGTANRDEANVTDIERVTAEDLDHLYAHLQDCLVEIGFLDLDKPRRLMRRLKKLFNRAGLDQNEYNILRGILTAVQESVRKK
ncbi:MAG: RNA methyltransferase [Gammaproteobacteria bacterium]